MTTSDPGSATAEPPVARIPRRRKIAAAGILVLLAAVLAHAVRQGPATGEVTDWIQSACLHLCVAVIMLTFAAQAAEGRWNTQYSITFPAIGLAIAAIGVLIRQTALLLAG